MRKTSAFWRWLEMIEVIIRYGVYEWKKFKLSDENEELIKKLSEELHMPIADVVKIAIKDINVLHENNSENMEKLQKELFDVKKEMFKLDKERGVLYTKNTLIIHELKELSVTLIGLVNQNRTLRRILKMEKKYEEAKKLAEHYLFSDPYSLMMGSD